ncbi:hypothetical protein HIM_05968 [Hirsutella minnesotensis 3608]|uniref:Uncharacterized protein n=1 Tax=Hirsutella minnesotensis 3608 TaxID=1043627 RepID=A0A0F7ZUC4_9HYPO|nr:hypothetical protein HIM_05968 [Hirsutella minnesotensis 3608]
MVQAEQSPSWAVMDLMFPSSLPIRVISIICFILGTLIILPALCCVVYDLFLWTWRFWADMFSSTPRSAASEHAEGDHKQTPTTKNAKNGRQQPEKSKYRKQ